MGILFPERSKTKTDLEREGGKGDFPPPSGQTGYAHQLRTSGAYGDA